MRKTTYLQGQDAETFGAPAQERFSPDWYSPDWYSLEYLRAGSRRQREVYALLTEAGVFAALADFSPCLVGTIPLDIDIPRSDADIVCCAPRLEEFSRPALENFGEREGFSLRNGAHQGAESVIASFVLGAETQDVETQSERAQALRVEIFAQNTPVERQRAYRHLAVEARLLRLAGEKARQEIRRLKEAGMKTEPAFVAYFGIEVGGEGDAFERLYGLYSASDEELARACRNIHTHTYN